MLDTNVFDLIAADRDVALELGNRRDLLCVLTQVQLDELAAIPDEGRRAELLGLARELCRSVAPGTGAPERPPERPPERDDAVGRHEADRLIAAAAEARCDYLVTGDEGLLEYARDLGIPAMDWRRFRRLVLRIR